MSPPSFDLTGRRAVVTGASRGIGAGIALGLARAGADIVDVSRGASDTGDTARVVAAAGRGYEAVRADLADRDSLAAAIDRIRAGGVVDILICNAGIARRAPAEDHSDEAWDETLAVDLDAPFLLARELGRGMLARGSGRVVFIASMMSFQGGRDVVSYAAAKSAVVGVVRALANEWAGRGVNVNAIAPGYIETDLTMGSHGDPVRRERFRERIPAGRWGRPEDVAGAAVFLCADASEYVHGVVLPVDGGWLVR